MINMVRYGIKEIPTSVIINDLVALANLEKNSVDSKVLSISNNIITIEGKYITIEGKYAVVGGEIVKIISCSENENNTDLNIERQCFGTIRDIQINSHFRTVIILENNSDFILREWSFNDTIGNVTSSLFPVELGTGNIVLKSNLELWSPYSTSQRYKVRPRKTIAYIFKGLNDIRFLKFTTVVTKSKFNTKGKSEPNKIILEIKSKLSQWYDKDIIINKQLKGTTPKEFFKLIFDLKDDEVYYANGVDENSFLSINNLHTKEYTKISEILKAYCSNGVRFCFDAKEKLKIFGDFKVDNIESEKIVDYEITDSMLSEDEQMIYNTINTKSVQRQTLYNFEDLENKYVNFFKVKNNVIDSNKFISIQENGDYTVNSIEIQDEDFHSSVQLKDYVLFKRTVEPYNEFYARVIAIESENKVIVVPILYDKDYKLFFYGKGEYLYNLLVTNHCMMDLHYVRRDLPIIFKYTRNKNGDEVDSSLALPLLPRVNGETKYQTETNITFGCASNLDVGSYTGIVEEVDKIYGVWDSTKLLYNMELTQFSNSNYPPIFALTNKCNERLINNTTPLLNYTHFDNSNFLLEIERPQDTSCDAVIKMSNTLSVNKDIDLYVGKEIGRIGNKILEVESLEPYKLGDVLIVNKPDDLTPQEETEFDEVLSTIRWTITAKETQTVSEGVYKHYIFVDSNFAKRKQQDKVYEFTRFPNWSVVFLQELYFRGNPVIEFSQDVVGFSKGVTISGDTSKELYGEKRYELDSKQLNKENLKMLMGYVLNNFQAVNTETTKFNVPVSVFNGIDIELLDVISVNDPVYTKIKDTMKWVVISTTVKSNTNEVQLKLLNVNSKNTEPYDINIKDVIEYEPVEIPDYDHTGGEGNEEDNNDGNGGTDIDKALGQFWLAEVDPQKFRARVEKFEGNYIYFKDFNGEEYEDYQNKLFPADEFAVNIKGEVIFVQSDMNYRAFIKKRNVYGTEEVIIAPEDDIKFLVTTTYVDIDGTFFGRKMMMGDGDSYLSVDPITGVKVMGDFVVGENNKNPDNDLWNAMQNNRVFKQDTKPVSTSSYTLKENDVWYDTANGNRVYIYKNGDWQNTQDQDIVTALGNAKIFYQPEPPTSGMKEHDLWYDTDDQNHPYVYMNGKWTSARDKIFETEGGNKVYFQDTQPPTSGYGIKEGDMWFDTGNNNTLYILMDDGGGVNNLKWILANDSLDKINQGKVVINANTVFNGDATIVSQGENETTVIKGGEITFTRGGLPLTTIKNVRVGTIRTDSKGKGRVKFENFKNTVVFTSIKSFNISENIRSMNAYAVLSDVQTNEWQFFLYGTENTIGELLEKKYDWTYPSFSTTVKLKYAILNSINYHLFVSTNEQWDSLGRIEYWVEGKVSYTLKVTSNNGSGEKILLKNDKITNINLNYFKHYIPNQHENNTVWWLDGGEINEEISLNEVGDFNLDTFITVEISNVKVTGIAFTRIHNYEWANVNYSYRGTSKTLNTSSLTVKYSENVIVETKGEGDVQYIAMEI